MSKLSFFVIFPSSVTQYDFMCDVQVFSFSEYLAHFKSELGDDAFSAIVHCYKSADELTSNSAAPVIVDGSQVFPALID